MACFSCLIMEGGLGQMLRTYGATIIMDYYEHINFLKIQNALLNHAGVFFGD